MHNLFQSILALVLVIVLLMATSIIPFGYCRACYAEPNSERNCDLFAKNNLVAWCVVPYDNQKRTPEQRTRMLQELGFRSLAWDWRQKHLGSLEEEISLLEEARIELKAVWCWIDGRESGALGVANDQLLATLERMGAKTEIWVSFAAPFFAELPDDEKVSKGAEMVATLCKKAQAIGCRVSLYNHGDWFGEPCNMVKIIQYLDVKDVGLVYNFHHAHSQIAKFQSNLALMMPYLSTVNLNGMRVDGPKILPLGSGDHEEVMMKQLKEAGFKGRIGILGHIEDADVKDVLTKNLAGMKKLLRHMGETEALATY